MKPLIETGDLVKVEPVDNRKLNVGDIVLCRVKGRHYLHLIKATRKGQYQIGNNKGHINGWIHKNAVYGIAMEIAK